jgi:hypothetical protein
LLALHILLQADADVVGFALLCFWGCGRAIIGNVRQRGSSHKSKYTAMQLRLGLISGSVMLAARIKL